jgi:flagellar biosynthesis anti-sigma factor FlgM
MTNTIPPFSQTPPPVADSAAPARQTGSAADPAADAAAQSDSVTLSAAAQTSTQLLNAARDSDGVDQAIVQQIRTSLQNGSYNVTPEDLAQAIAAVLKESR